MRLVDIIDEIRIGFDWLPKTKKGAEAFGRRSAIRGCHIDNNPYDRGDGIFSGSYTNGKLAYLVYPNDNRIQLARAYHDGFGKVVWVKMNEGYVAYPGFFEMFICAISLKSMVKILQETSEMGFLFVYSHFNQPTYTYPYPRRNNGLKFNLIAIRHPIGDPYPYICSYSFILLTNLLFSARNLITSSDSSLTPPASLVAN